MGVSPHNLPQDAVCGQWRLYWDVPGRWPRMTFFRLEILCLQLILPLSPGTTHFSVTSDLFIQFQSSCRILAFAITLFLFFKKISRSTTGLKNANVWNLPACRCLNSCKCKCIWKDLVLFINQIYIGGHLPKGKVLGITQQFTHLLAIQCYN